MPSSTRRWLTYLLAILLGNGLYFALSPYLPPAARNAASEVGVSTLVDLWFCLFVYGLLQLGAFIHNRRGRNTGGPLN
jgi:hypothetical protein